MEMSAIAAKNIANMAYYDWSNGFENEKTFEVDKNINTEKWKK